MLGRPRTHPEPEFTSVCQAAESKEQSLQKPVKTLAIPQTDSPRQHHLSIPQEELFTAITSGQSGISGLPSVELSALAVSKAGSAVSRAGSREASSPPYTPKSSAGSIPPSASLCIRTSGELCRNLPTATSATSDPDSQSIRVVEPVKRSRRVETKNTIASSLLGKGSRLENMLFRMAVQNYWTSRLLWSLWLAGVGLGLTSLIQWIDLHFVWCSVLMLPLPAFTVMVLSIDLVLEVLTQFEYYLITSLQVFLAAAAAGMLRDKRIVFWVCLMPSMLIATLIDAYPHRYRRIFSVMFFSAMQGMLLFWAAALTFRLVPLTDSWFELAYLEGKVASTCCSMMVTLSAFCCRHLFVSIWKPDHFVLILGSVRTLKVQVKTELNQGEDGNLRATYVRTERRISTLSVRADGSPKKYSCSSGDGSALMDGAAASQKDDDLDSGSGLSEASSVPTEKEEASSDKERSSGPELSTGVASGADVDGEESKEIGHTISDGNQSGSALEQTQACLPPDSETGLASSALFSAPQEPHQGGPLEPGPPQLTAETEATGQKTSLSCQESSPLQWPRDASTQQFSKHAEDPEAHTDSTNCPSRSSALQDTNIGDPSTGAEVTDVPQSGQGHPLERVSVE